MPTPRGIRNNNPGNIERVKGVRWQGEAKVQKDKRFVTFATPEDGIRAIARVLVTYQDKRRAKDGSKIDTLAEIVERWAPAGENDTGRYVRHLETLTSIGADKTIDVYDPATMKALVKAIIRHENGMQPYTGAQIDAGLALFGIREPGATMTTRRRQAGEAAGAATVGVGAGAVVVDNHEEIAETIEPAMPWAGIALDWVVAYGTWAAVAGAVAVGGFILWRHLRKARAAL